MKEGKLYKNSSGRYQLKGDSLYFTCGDTMQTYNEDEGKWIRGRVEHGDFDYYWTNDDYDIPLQEGMLVRA